MKVKLLPDPCAIILDNDKGAMRGIMQSLKPNLDLSIKTFSSPATAWDTFRSKRLYEPLLLITDSIGVRPQEGSFLSRIQRRYPRIKVVLFSGSTSEQEAFQLLNHANGIHRFVSKNEPTETLTSTSIDFVKEYEMNVVLRSMRTFVNKCVHPKAKFMNIAGRDYNIIEVYWEVVRQTSIGRMMEASWLSLIVSVAAKTTT